MNDLSTTDYANLIADSITNGQHAQARAQFKRAIDDHCSVTALCIDMEHGGLSAEKITLLLCSYIERI